MRAPIPFRSAALALVVLLALLLGIAPPAAAQDVAGVTLRLTVNVPRAKVGEIVEYTVRVANAGTEPIAGLSVALGLPDALDARSVYCPSGTVDAVIACEIGDLAPGSVAEAKFYVHVGVREPNGQVTAQLLDAAYNVIANAELPPLKIIGRPTPR